VVARAKSAGCEAGLKVESALDTAIYEKGIKSANF
jgi:hypothetical protein